jgi:predicted enzyme related to lactoylglutathione lyase
MDKVVHFEIPADDVPRASEFYRSIFGWNLMDMSGQGMDYTIAMTAPVDEQQRPTEPGAINGGMMKRSAEVPAPVITIEVAAIDDAMARIEGAGGSVVQPRQEIPGMGAFAYFRDSEGNVLGLWENAASS